jgi:diguanylate cyclase (GGDEF)-like protein
VRTADESGVGATNDRNTGCRWFVAIFGLVAAAYPTLPADLRLAIYPVLSGCIVAPLIALMRGQRRRDRLPWLLLAIAMSVLTLGNALTAIGGQAQQTNAELVVALGHAVLLIAAAVLVLRRGRNDLGGLLDVSVAALGLGGLLWTALVFPRLDAFGAGAGDQVAVLTSILVLAGVLGALGRVWLVSDYRIPALGMLLVALVLALVGNVIQAMATGTMTTGRPGWIEMFFLLAYLCVGAAALHSSVHELTRPGPVRDDRLSPGRLVFLGLALAVPPLVGGVRQLAGLPADGALLAVGGLLVAPLVMVRVGRLARQREHAEQALRHQATHDALTGLPNRGELLRRLDAALRRERLAGRPAVVLLFCDLNGFKDVNDRLGHLAGDRLLAEVGARIQAGLRAGDVVARYGGDEFLVLCEAQAQAQAQARLCGHIESALALPFQLNGEPIRISSSVGAVLSDGTARPDELITRADQAMYRAKQSQHPSSVA